MGRSCEPSSIRRRYFAATFWARRSTSPPGSWLGEPSTLDTFVHDIGTIVGMELAQIRLLEEFFDVPVPQARLSFGHSIGELSALVVGGMYTMEQLLPIPLALATDCAELTANTTMGILSIQGGPLADRGRAAPLFHDQQPRAGVDRAFDVPLAVPGSAAWVRDRRSILLEARNARVPARRALPCGASRTIGRPCTRRWCGSAIFPTAPP